MMTALEMIAMQVDARRYAQLNALCWNRGRDVVLSGAEAHALYERNWRFIEPDKLSRKERDLIDRLVLEFGPLLVAG